MKFRPFSNLLVLLALLALGCTSNSAKSKYVLAEKLWNEKKFDAAAVEFERVATLDKNGALGLQALFRAAMTETLFLGKHESALKKFKLIGEITPDQELKWESSAQAGEILFNKLEQYDLTIRHYKGMIQSHPNKSDAPELHYRIGRSYFFLFQFDEATAHYKEILRLFPGTHWSEKSQFQLAMTSYTKGDAASLQQAMDDFTAFIKDHPKSSLAEDAKFGVANCLEELDQLDAAYRHYEALLNTYPSPNVIRIKMTRIRERNAQKKR